MAATWDLTALVNAADPKAPLAERHLWLVRLTEWLRHAPTAAAPAPTRDAAPDGSRPEPPTPLPLRRLKLLLAQVEGHPEVAKRVQGVLGAFWREIDAAALFADFGFGPRMSLASELLRRVGLKLLPGTPDTTNLAELFQLLFEPDDARWLAQMDGATLARVAALLGPPTQEAGGAGDGGDGGDGDAARAPWRGAMLDAITILASAVHASGYAPGLRLRMDRELLRDDPFRLVAPAAEALRRALLDPAAADAGPCAPGAGPSASPRALQVPSPAALQAAQWLRAALDACRRAAASVTAHLEAYGVSLDIVYAQDQLRRRTERIEALLGCVLAPDPRPELLHLMRHLLATADEQRRVRRLLARHGSLLARQVAERNAETGEHYITTDRASWHAMLRAAAGGGAVIAGTTFVKFAVAALGMSVFWTGFWSGVNYALSFVVIMLLHWTVATKQPAMTAPAMAATLAGPSDDASAERFVDRVAQLIRSQAAGIAGNLAVCAPLVLAVQLAWGAAAGAPPVGPEKAEYVLHSLTLLGPTALYAAFTGVLLFASSLVAGWVENAFVLRRLDSAIEWNPRIVAVLGATRARRWARWWRGNVSGLAANVSLGMMLGLVPAVFAVLALPLEVRHVTLSTGQLAAAAGALGWDVLYRADFWWCVAGIAVTGLLNLGVSFWLAFKVALRSRGVQVRERERIGAALRQRLLRQPMSFVRPPREFG